MNRSTARASTGLLCAAALWASGGCANGQSPNGASATLTSVVRVTSLPLQPSVPTLGGDRQPQIQDIARVRLTDSQVKRIQQACQDASEVAANRDQPCQKVMMIVVQNGAPCIPGSLCINVGIPDEGPLGLVQIVDSRPGRPLCGSGPNGLCFQLPASVGIVRSLAKLAPGTGSSSSTSTDTSSATDTTIPTSPTPSETPSSSNGEGTPTPSVSGAAPVAPSADRLSGSVVGH